MREAATAAAALLRERRGRLLSVIEAMSCVKIFLGPLSCAGLSQAALTSWNLKLGPMYLRATLGTVSRIQALTADLARHVKIPSTARRCEALPSLARRQPLAQPERI